MALTHGARRHPNSQPGTSENTRPLAGAIAALKAEVDAAIARGDGHVAELAHDLLLDAEWAQRCVETIRKHSA